ncbi:metallophosphoesterase [Psychromonas sp.]|uniref:metallophosphoesterase n=1 Tax=Psychromonas sp. TaxID=1884585 RepID=UPI0035613632
MINYSLPVHCYYSLNQDGRDFFVGDIHGKFALFKRALDQINFDFTVDRLFSVGDLIDRGEASFKCLLLAKKSWFIPAIGNHEQFLLDTANNDLTMKMNWYFNGGSWWDALYEEEKQLAQEIVESCYCLTLGVTTLAGEVGVIHAQYPFNQWPASKEDLDPDSYYELIWGRDYINDDNEHLVEGIDFIVSGHTPLNKPRLKYRQLFIDTGCGHQPGGFIADPHLTICEFKKHRIELYAISETGFELSSIDI